MKIRSKYNEVKVANISRVTVTFLEVGVWKEGSRFVTPPEFKPTSPWQPQGYDSAHAPHCRASPCFALCEKPHHVHESEVRIDRAFQRTLRPRICDNNFAKYRWACQPSNTTAALSIGFSPAFYKESKRAAAVFQESSRYVQWFQKGVSRKVPTTQNCLEERDASPQSSHLQNVHSWQISDVILSGLLSKLPYEQEFENPVNISPPKCALTSFTPVSAFCCFSFLNMLHNFEKTSPVTCESKNPASFVSALEK